MLGTSQLLSEVDGQIIPFDFWNLVPDDRERIDRLKQQGAKGVWRLGNFEADALFRLLAKVAHASAVAALGVGGFEAQFVDIISGDMSRGNELVGELPGESAGLLPSSHYLQGLHQIAVGLHEAGGVRYVLVHIRLFSNLLRGPKIRFSAAWPPYFTPSYAVIAGMVR
jgi:hypothetical protein